MDWENTSEYKSNDMAKNVNHITEYITKVRSNKVRIKVPQGQI
jgi:hypothetical protein